jgi:hypothetical protein
MQSPLDPIGNAIMRNVTNLIAEPQAVRMLSLLLNNVLVITAAS